MLGKGGNLGIINHYITQSPGLLYRHAQPPRKAISVGQNILQLLLPERDYVTFGSLLSQIRLSSVCRLSVTLVHPTQGVEAFGKISSPLCTLAIL